MQPVSKSELKEMKDLYEKHIRKSSTKKLKKKFPHRPGIEDAGSTWVSKKELLELLEHNNANGLRIHYGCHHKSTHDNPLHDCHGLHNVILVATIDNVTPDNPTTENSIDHIKDDHEIKTALAAGDVKGAFYGNGGDLMPLCPPTCAGTGTKSDSLT